ncbi:MAG: hypothetical protein HQ523_10010 [Lentisphaerae bacterium]|nr:hypothetical protein [Lentisphaerota bacterium]
MALALTALLMPSVRAQNLRYDNHREVSVPEYATIRVGPFHSSWVVSATTGYRWINTSGVGTDFLFSGSRGRVKKDGSDFPIILGLDTRNYLIIGPHTDLDLSVSFRYEYYPLDTQESEFRVYLPTEGVTANLSMEMSPTPYLRLRVWDGFGWQADYIDARGLEDRYGGQRFENISNSIGVDGDLLLAERQNLGFGVSRSDRWALDREWEHQNRVIHAGHLLYEYQVAEYATLGLRAGLSHIDYPQTNRPSTLINEYMVQLGTRLTERTTATLFAGYAIGTISGSGSALAGVESDLSTAIYGAGLQTELTPRLTHGISYAHGLRGGYTSALEEFDSLRYTIGWNGDFSRWSAYTGFLIRDPSSTNVPGYSDWTSGVLGEVPLLPYLSLVGSVHYSERSNDAADGVAVDLESRSDYNTWAFKAGPEVRLTDEFNLSAYAEHIERDGEDDALDYTRDIVAVLLTYRHEL